MEAAAIRSKQDAMIIGMSRSAAAPVARASRSSESEAGMAVLGEALMDVQDVAAFLHVSKSMVYKLAASGDLPAVRIGRLVRFTRRGVDSFVRSETA
jgi:excisionase family DNA binding protein